MTTLKFIAVLLAGSFAWLIIGAVMFKLRLLLIPINPLLFFIGFSPILAWRGIADPAGKLAYIPAIIIPSLLVFVAFSGSGIEWSAIATSFVSIAINVAVLKYGGDYIYKDKRVKRTIAIPQNSSATL